jgi:peptide chain release factor
MLRGHLPILRRNLALNYTITSYITKCSIATTSARWAKKMPDKPKPPPEEEFTEAFLKGSGPGGQKIVCTCQLQLVPLLPQRELLRISSNKEPRTKHRPQCN